MPISWSDLVGFALTVTISYNVYYYMASSVSGQDEPNRAL